MTLLDVELTWGVRSKIAAEPRDAAIGRGRMGMLSHAHLVLHAGSQAIC